MGDKVRMLADTEEVINILTDTAEVEEHLASLNSEMEVLRGLAEKLIQENASTAQFQDEYETQYSKLTAKYDAAKDKLEKAIAERNYKNGQALKLNAIIHSSSSHSVMQVSASIYEKFCETLGWDIEKVTCFGWQTLLYAMNADTMRGKDVWFICYPNYELDKVEAVVEDEYVITYILNDGEEIIEKVAERIGPSNDADRIKTSWRLLFYKEIVKNKNLR